MPEIYTRGQYEIARYDGARYDVVKLLFDNIVAKMEQSSGPNFAGVIAHLERD
jgi:hypothetical protein